MNTRIVCQGVSKFYNRKAALESVSVTAEKGRIIGLLGPNGSGKSTLLRTIAGLIKPSDGSCVTLGVDSMVLERDQLKELGYVEQESSFIEWMTIKTHLDYIGSYYSNWDVNRMEHLLKLFQLDVKARISSLSTGDRQKVGIIGAVCHHPKLILMDEPASSLDPTARADLFQFLLSLMEEDEATIVISSHILSDIEKVVDRIWFINGSRLVLDDDLDNIQERFYEWRVCSTSGKALPLLFNESYVLRQQGEGAFRTLVVMANEQEKAAFEDAHSVSVEVSPLSLEDLFPALSGELEAVL